MQRKCGALASPLLVPFLFMMSICNGGSALAATTPAVPVLRCGMQPLRKFGAEDLGLNPNTSAFDSYDVLTPFIAPMAVGRWHLYYAGGPISGVNGSCDPYGYCRDQLGLATSESPRGPWQRHGPPLLPLGDKDNFHVSPTLLRGENNEILWDDGELQMVFNGNRNDDIYLATSPDGIRWTKKYDAPVFRGYAPNVLRINGTLWLYSVSKPVNGSPWNITVATGKSWQTLEHRQTVLQPETQRWESGSIFYPFVVYEPVSHSWSLTYSSYGHRTDYNVTENITVTAIGMAVSQDGLHFEKCVENPILGPTAGSYYDSTMVGSPSWATVNAAGRPLAAPLLYYAGRIDNKHQYFSLSHATAAASEAQTGGEDGPARSPGRAGSDMRGVVYTV